MYKLTHKMDIFVFLAFFNCKVQNVEKFNVKRLNGVKKSRELGVKNYQPGC